jgi:Leucine-rich repeat (LRR) protein
MNKCYLLLAFFCLVANAQTINFPDPKFKAKLMQSGGANSIAKNAAGQNIKIDANNNGEIEVNEALEVYRLQIPRSNPSLPELPAFEDMEGISNFTNLVYLSFTGNRVQTLNANSLQNLKMLYCASNELTSLEVNNLVHLDSLSCGGNRLTNLDLRNSSNLKKLSYSSNNISSLDLSNLVNLTSLYCSDNGISSLNVSHMNNLKTLYADTNLLTSLNVNNLTNLRTLVVDNNRLTALDLSNLNDLRELSFSNNQLSTFNASNLVNLQVLYCGGNALTSIDLSNSPRIFNIDFSNSASLVSVFLKNGSEEVIQDFTSLPNLQYICVDENQIEIVRDNLNYAGNTTCNVNSYCSFNPGGTFYTVQGTTTLDGNNNGCDASDIHYPNLKFNITDGINTGNLIASASGNFTIDVQAGTYTITPILENQAYFTTSPVSVTVDFPAQVSPFSQNFCITPNGIHPDLEVVLLPIDSARPGFDTDYKLVYKNKGNITQSGSVNLVFNDNVLDFVTVAPAPNSQVLNTLSWDFTNLAPFETREIRFTINVNSPMETPAVNAGDILQYTATISPTAGDETLEDNTFVLNQRVVNSYDPNDKICLEGGIIDPDKVGEYVHYRIRFENTGTYPAQNIVVKDMIDASKFDINSLIPLNGSHPFVTKITGGNKVEFVFENINLPFDDANNDGYILFKVKTLPTLTNGDTFENSASIYFDYNFPILTNTAITTVQALNNQDLNFAENFIVYPNPVKDVLTITVKETTEISSLNVYNMLGQLVLAVPNAENVKQIDVSGLKKGNYLLKVNSNKGTFSTRFLKH